MAVTETAIALKVTMTKDTAQADVLCVHASIAQHTTRSREKADTNSVRTTIAKADTSSVHATIVKAVISSVKAATSSAKAVICHVKAAISHVLATTAKVAISNVKAVINLVKVTPLKGELEEATVLVLPTIILMPSTA